MDVEQVREERDTERRGRCSGEREKEIELERENERERESESGERQESKRSATHGTRDRENYVLSLGAFYRHASNTAGIANSSASKIGEFSLRRDCEKEEGKGSRNTV